jgi:hypothetical protein
VGNTYSAGSANGFAAGTALGPLEGEWNLWVPPLAGIVIGIGIVGYKNWCWCIDGKKGNKGSFGHIGERRSSRMSNHRLVDFEMNRKLLLAAAAAVVVEIAVVVGTCGSHKRRNPLLLTMAAAFVLFKDYWVFEGFECCNCYGYSLLVRREGKEETGK